MVQRDQNERDESSAGGLRVAGDKSGFPLLDIEVRQVAVSGGCHQFHRCYRGCGVFMSVQKSNHNTLHTNPNF